MGLLRKKVCGYKKKGGDMNRTPSRCRFSVPRRPPLFDHWEQLALWTTVYSTRLFDHWDCAGGGLPQCTALDIPGKNPLTPRDSNPPHPSSWLCALTTEPTRPPSNCLPSIEVTQGTSLYCYCTNPILLLQSCPGTTCISNHL